MKLENLIRQYRWERRLTQIEFADKCKISKGYVSALETNSLRAKKIFPTLEMCQKLANGMEISVSELMTKIAGPDGQPQI